MSLGRLPDMDQSGDENVKTRDQSTESDSKRGSAVSPAPRKRTSRAGTRSVNNLTNDQLERKRANDREAQRQIRLRTKETIAGLERRVKELESSDASKTEEIITVRMRLQELERENADYRARYGSAAFVLPTSGDEG